MLTRIIPSTGESLPVIGIGTYKGFDVGSSSKERAALGGVLRNLFSLGGSVLDSSPMYGRAEGVAGDLLAEQHAREKAFVATKVWTQGRAAGIDQMNHSMKLLRCERIDLMQIHNLVDWRTHLATLRAWKEEGRIRYLGITHYSSSAYGEMEKIMRAETLDFVQLNYSLDEREAERRLLPLAAERGMAVLVNLPFGQGRLFRTLRGKPIPPWMQEAGCEHVVSGLAEIYARSQSRDLRHPGNRKSGSHGGKLSRGRWGDAGGIACPRNWSRCSSRTGFSLSAFCSARTLASFRKTTTG